MLSSDEVKKIASLARIGLKEKEIPKYQKDLSAILNYFEKLKELNTEKIDPVGHITGRFNATRKDEPKDFDQAGKETILKNAPERKDGFVKVRNVL